MQIRYHYVLTKIQKLQNFKKKKLFSVSAGIAQNWPIRPVFFLVRNRGVEHTELLAGTVYFSHTDRYGTKSITLIRTTKSINTLGSLTDSPRPSPQINTINNTFFFTQGEVLGLVCSCTGLVEIITHIHFGIHITILTVLVHCMHYASPLQIWLPAFYRLAADSKLCFAVLELLTLEGWTVDTNKFS